MFPLNISALLACCLLKLADGSLQQQNLSYFGHFGYPLLSCGRRRHPASVCCNLYKTTQKYFDNYKDVAANRELSFTMSTGRHCITHNALGLPMMLLCSVYYHGYNVRASRKKTVAELMLGCRDEAVLILRFVWEIIIFSINHLKDDRWLNPGQLNLNDFV